MIENKIILIVIGNSNQSINSYELIRILTRRFKIWRFLELIDDNIKENVIERVDFPSSQIGSYRLTEKGLEKFMEIDKHKFLNELLNVYPEQEIFLRHMLS